MYIVRDSGLVEPIGADSERVVGGGADTGLKRDTLHIYDAQAVLEVVEE